MVSLRFTNKPAPKVPNNIPKNPSFWSFVSFSIVLVIPFNKKIESSRAWTVFIMSFISSFEIIKVVVPEPCIFFWIPASVAEAAAAIPYAAKILFAYGTATFINGPTFALSNEPKNLPDWINLNIWALEILKCKS